MDSLMVTRYLSAKAFLEAARPLLMLAEYYLQ